MDLYPMLKNVNSQQSEQINRSLRSLSVVLAFSTFEHYMKILEMYFVYKNVETRPKAVKKKLFKTFSTLWPKKGSNLMSILPPILVG